MNAEVNMVVIGSSVAGLSYAALAQYGLKVIVCESHAIPGEAAHSFERDGFKFDSGFRFILDFPTFLLFNCLDRSLMPLEKNCPV